MNIIQKLLSPGPQKTVNVEITRNCHAGEKSFTAGERFNVPEKLARELVAAGAALDLDAEQEAREELAKRENLLPPPVEAKPLPDGWQNLPECFKTWWGLNQSAWCLTERRDAIWESFIKQSNRFLFEGDLRSIGNLPDGIKREKAFSAIARAIHVGAIPKDHIARVEYLKDAFVRSEDAISQWRETNREKLAVAHFQCSQHALAEHGKLSRAIRELHALGRELFATRITPLGLGDWKIDELFRGSADAVKFASISLPDLQDLRLAFTDETGPHHYLSTTPATQVSMIRGWETAGAQVANLTAQAKRELTAVRRIQKAA